MWQSLDDVVLPLDWRVCWLKGEFPLASYQPQSVQSLGCVRSTFRMSIIGVCHTFHWLGLGVSAFCTQTTQPPGLLHSSMVQAIQMSSRAYQSEMQCNSMRRKLQGRGVPGGDRMCKRTRDVCIVCVISDPFEYKRGYNIVIDWNLSWKMCAHVHSGSRSDLHWCVKFLCQTPYLQALLSWKRNFYWPCCW